MHNAPSGSAPLCHRPSERIPARRPAAIDIVDATGSHSLTGVSQGTLGELVGRAATEDDYRTIAKNLASVAAYAREKGVAPVALDRSFSHLLR